MSLSKIAARTREQADQNAQVRDRPAHPFLSRRARLARHALDADRVQVAGRLAEARARGRRDRRASTLARPAAHARRRPAVRKRARRCASSTSASAADALPRARRRGRPARAGRRPASFLRKGGGEGAGEDRSRRRAVSRTSATNSTRTAACRAQSGANADVPARVLVRRVDVATVAAAVVVLACTDAWLFHLPAWDTLPVGLEVADWNDGDVEAARVAGGRARAGGRDEAGLVPGYAHVEDEGERQRCTRA